MNYEDLFVLVIEPSKVQRTIIVNHLKSFGIHKIDEYDGAAQALEGMQTQLPDLVVSSMHLPDMTGTDVVTLMRKDEQLAHITFLLISSETHYRYLEPIRQSGAIAILPKPFSRKDLLSALQSTLLYLSDQDTEASYTEEEFEELRILVVDDSKLSRNYVCKILRNIGVETILEANDGNEAISQVENQAFDLIITDYNMPNLDGREMVEKIRQNSDQASVPIIMITSEQNPEQLTAIQKSGVSALCSKPLSYEMAKRIIERLVLDKNDY
ncbi:response regulator [Neptunomonas phycophila]|uniref:response regulator n=2 Tax=Neptunomonas phycophila TaxID=1572645 RepID=UPI000948B3BE|nr:response regulator [Neptunomonas phycophila]QLE98204.1 response regulator [Neptunomonas phycophila]